MKTFHVKTIGFSHIKKEKPCQDSTQSHYTPNSQVAIAVVCDGHGGDKYFRSDVGSQLATEVAMAAITTFCDTYKAPQGNDGELWQNKALDQLIKNIIEQWNEKVLAHWEAHKTLSPVEQSTVPEKYQTNFTRGMDIESAYGTTLIAVAHTPAYWFGIHIGDGKCVVFNTEGTASQPIPWDDKCVYNVTTSMCDSKAYQHFRRHFSTSERPMAIFIASDGVDDSYGTETSLTNFYSNLITLFHQKEFNEAITELEAFIPKLSEKGSFDDIAIAGILDMGRIDVFLNKEAPHKIDLVKKSKKVKSLLRKAQKMAKLMQK